MSQSFNHEPRRSFTERQRAELFSACAGICANCRRKIRAGMDWDIDHRIALADGGTNDDDNLQVLCDLCHSAKTTDDMSSIAKGKRAMVKAFVPRRFRARRGWR